MELPLQSQDMILHAKWHPASSDCFELNDGVSYFVWDQPPRSYDKYSRATTKNETVNNLLQLETKYIVAVE